MIIVILSKVAKHKYYKQYDYNKQMSQMDTLNIKELSIRINWITLIVSTYKIKLNVLFRKVF